MKTKTIVIRCIFLGGLTLCLLWIGYLVFERSRFEKDMIAHQSRPVGRYRIGTRSDVHVYEVVFKAKKPFEVGIEYWNTESIPLETDAGISEIDLTVVADSYSDDGKVKTSLGHHIYRMTPDGPKMLESLPTADEIGEDDEIVAYNFKNMEMLLPKRDSHFSILSGLHENKFYIVLRDDGGFYISGKRLSRQEIMESDFIEKHYSYLGQAGPVNSLEWRDGAGRGFVASSAIMGFVHGFDKHNPKKSFGVTFYPKYTPDANSFGEEYDYTER